MNELERRQVSANVADGRFGGFPLTESRKRGFVGPMPLAVIGILFLSLLLTASGAYDTDDMALPHRWAFWLVFSVLVVGQACGLEHALGRALRGRAASGWIAAAAATAITVLLLAIELHGLKFTPLLPKEPDPFFEFVLFVAPPVSAVCLFALIVKAGLIDAVMASPLREPVVSSRGGEFHLGVPEPPSGDSPDQLAEWPDAPVLRVRSRDHYLEVVTAQGTHFVRGRMQDAMRHLANEKGVQTHRSWWVAQAEISGARANGRDYVLRLNDGSEIPVARARKAELRALRLL